MPRQVCLAHFELLVAVVALLETQNALERGLFLDKNGSQTAQNVFFQKKNDARPFGLPKPVKSTHFEPIATDFGSSRSAKCLEMGCCATKNGSKMGPKRGFPKMIWDNLGCTNN